MTVVDADVIDDARQWLARSPGAISADRVAQALRASGRPLGDEAVLSVVAHLRRELLGAGPLQPLIALPGVTDVVVNGPSQVFIDRGAGLEATEVRFSDDEAVRRLAQRLAAGAGRRLDDASPYVDARLPDGTRLHAVLAPIAAPGTAISLRIPGSKRLGWDICVPVELRGVVSEIVSARLSVLISGGTGSGKTTLLAGLLSRTDPAERLVVVEDSRELALTHPHVVYLEARPANVEGAGAVVLQDLVRQALRMRPDRLVVGEVRGAEVIDLLAALNTGHEGGLGTLHANRAADVPARLEALALAAGMSRMAVHSQVRAGVDVVLHLSRRTRQIVEIAVPTVVDGLVEMVSALSVDTAETGAEHRISRGPGARLLADRLSQADR